jgi:protease IV
MKFYFWFLIGFVFQNCVAFNQVKFLDLPEKTLELNEFLIQGSDKDKILLVSVDGVISDSSPSGPFGLSVEDSMLAHIKEELSKASSDSMIKGVILKVDSPGGGVTASDIIYRELNEYKKKTGNPIVALFMDTAASGGYYISMSADAIIAHPTTVTGSIGVIVSGLNIKEGLDKIGVKDQTFTSGANKNILSPFAEMTPEKQKIIQSIVDNLYNRFFTIVKKNRTKIEPSKLKQLADGRIFTAEQALAEGLVDKIGYSEDAIRLMMGLPNYRKTVGGNNNPRIITYRKDRKAVKNFYQTNQVPDNILQVMSQKLRSQTEVKFLYQWQ